LLEVVTSTKCKINTEPRTGAGSGNFCARFEGKIKYWFYSFLCDLIRHVTSCEQTPPHLKIHKDVIEMKPAVLKKEWRLLPRSYSCISPAADQWRIRAVSPPATMPPLFNKPNYLLCILFNLHVNFGLVSPFSDSAQRVVDCCMSRVLAPAFRTYVI